MIWKQTRIITLSVLLFFAFFPYLQAQQTNVEFRERNFPGKEDAFKVAFDQYKTADRYFLRGPVYFPEALDNYLKAQAFNPDNADLNYQIGYCYLNLAKDRLKALPYLERARSLKQDMGADFLLNLGKAYHYSLEFDKAIQIFEAYLTSIGADAKPAQLEEADKLIAECESGKILIKKPIRVRIDNLGPGVNTPFPDYAPVLTEDEMKLLFTSRREGTTGEMVDPVDSMYFEDIYITYKVDGVWAPAKNIGKPINKEEHDASINITTDGKKLLIYRTSGGGDIFQSVQDGISWSDPKPLKGINTKWYENHAAYSIDGKQLYFISTRKDSSGLGGKDIYVADVDGSGNFSNVRNVGPTLNTKYDEDGLFCHPDGKTLYFSSHGHNTMGGFDIFRSTLLDGVWTKPENMGYPINSTEDDVFFIMSKDSRRGYFASYREEGFGSQDIYVMNFLNETELLSSLQFEIRDTVSNKPMMATIQIKDNVTGEIVVKRETENGETIANLPAGKTYEITITSEKYLPYTEIIEIPFDAGSQVMMRNIDMSRDKQAILTGMLVDKTDRIPVKGDVEFLDFNTREIVKLSVSDKTGFYKITLPPGKKYLAQIKAKGYQLFTDTLSLGADSAGMELTKGFELTKIDRNFPTVLKGKVFDLATGDSLNATISITEFGGTPVIIYQKPGHYDCIVYNGALHTITVNVEGYMTYTENLEIPHASEKQLIIHDIPLVKTETGAKIVLNNIFFDFNKSTLRPSSYKSLNNLLTTMKRYPAMEIEISGHTDNVGSMNYNQRLSDSRAKVVLEFLVRNGIPARHVSSYGRSFRQPIATNETNAGRQLNRRTEIKILKVK